MIVTKQSLDQLRRDIEAALTDVAKKHELTIKAGNIKYTSSGCTVAVTCSNVDASGLAAVDTHFTPEDLKPKLGQVFRAGGTEFRFVGWDQKRWKKPAKCVRVSDGAPFIFPEDSIRAHLGTPVAHHRPFYSDEQVRRAENGHGDA